MNKMKRIVSYIVGFLFFATAGVAIAAPVLEYRRTILPETTNTYDLGSAVKQWLTGYFGTICLSGDCKSSWPTGGGGGSGGGAWATNTPNTLTYLTSQWVALIGRTATTTRSLLEVNGTTTATNFVATSTTADSVFPRLSVTNSTTTNATSTSFFSTLLRATTGYFTSLYLPSLATPAGTLIAVDNNGQVIATTTPTGGGTPGGADTNVQFNDGGTFGGESGFTYQKSPTELVTMANGTVSGELRSNSLHETSAGVVGLNLDTTNITAQIGSSGFFKLKDGTSASELSMDTAALTGNHTVAFQDKDGTVALLSDITGASSTLLADSNTFSGANRFATMLVTGSTTLQNFTGLNATTSQATSTSFFSTNLWATRAVVGNATATGVIAVQGTGTSTYTGGIRALTAQFDALTAASCDLKADTSGNMYCGTDANTGGNAASTTSNFSIYKSGNTYYAYNATTTVVTSNASFSVLLQSVVDLMDAGKGGGSIYIQAGTYYVTSTTTIQGNGTAFDTPGGAIRIWGAGVGATKIVTTGNADFLAFDSVAVPMVSDLTVYMNGTSHAFYADSSNNAVRSMWMFYFANMQITSTSSATAVPLYLGNALRGLITNIEFTDTAGCGYFYSEGNWNPGDFDFIRSFCELQTTSNLVAFNFASTTSGGYMNQVHFDMVESIATGIGQTFMRGAPVKFSSFTNLNAEQFDTLVDGYNATFKNEWGFNYATHRTGVANLRGCRFGNTLNGIVGQAVLNTCTFKFLESDANFSVVDDMNTDPTRPNVIMGFFGSDAGSANASTGPSTLTIFRDISFYGTLDNNLAPSGLAGVFQTYGPLQTRSSKTASSSIRSDATSTFQTGISISTGCFAIANVCLSSSGSGASSTLLVNNNTFSGNNMFTGSSTILSFTALRSTTTAATTTDFTVTDAPIFSALSGLLKGNGSSPLTTAVDGTDFTLIDAMTCGAGQHLNSVTAAGVFTCSADSGGGGGGSGIGWTWNNVNSLYMSTTTDDLLLGATASSSLAKLEVNANSGLLSGAFLGGAVTINTTTTLHELDVNGRIHANQERVYCRIPFFSQSALTADGMGSATVAPPACTGEMWVDVNTDGTIQAIPDVPVEFASGTPFLQGVVAGNTTSGVANELIELKTMSLGSATSSMGNGIAAEWTMNLPNISTATTSVDWWWGFSDVGLGGKTTTATYATPVNSCMLVASSTANFLLVARKASVETRTTTSIATSTVAGSNSAKFLIVMDQNGCAVYLNGSNVAAGSISASAIPVVSNMKFNFGVGIRVGGFTTAGLARMNIGDITWWGQ